MREHTAHSFCVSACVYAGSDNAPASAQPRRCPCYCNNNNEWTSIHFARPKMTNHSPCSFATLPSRALAAIMVARMMLDAEYMQCAMALLWWSNAALEHLRSTAHYTSITTTSTSLFTPRQSGWLPAGRLANAGVRA